MRNDDLEKYYSRRASEYERIYQLPERQDDLRKLEQFCGEAFRDCNVLEIACGTGYWTRFVAQSAKSIVATDVNLEVLDLARLKLYPLAPDFRIADAYTLDGIPHSFNSALAGFWWSHVPKQRQSEFVNALHRHLQPDALVVMFDNRYVEGSNTPISVTDEFGNTYQDRKLADGTQHRVLKNFYSRDELQKCFESNTSDMRVIELQYYWIVSYRTHL